MTGCTAGTYCVVRWQARSRRAAPVESISIVEALAMASGRQLLHDSVPSTPLRVVLINLEDRRNTMDKRIAAVMRHYGLKKADIGDRLIVLAKGEVKFKVAVQTGPGNVERNEAAITALTDFMIKKQADVLSIDSFIRTHSVNENDNSSMQEVVECFEAIAVEANCAVICGTTQQGGRTGGDGEFGTRGEGVHRCLPQRAGIRPHDGRSGG